MDQRLLQAVENFKSGDEAAFETVYTMSFVRVKSGLVYMLKDEALSEDLAQETMMKVYRNIADLKDPSKYTAWANTIAANLAKDHLKKSMASEVTFSEMDVVTDSGEELPFEDSIESDKEYEQPEKAYDRKETARLVREIIDELPEGQRVAVTLFYYNDMKVKEIAELTESSENAVNQSLHQAKKKIEKKVRALEKQGVKLFSLAPVPFFIWLLHSAGEASAATTAAASGAAAIMAGAGTAGTVQAAASAGTAAGAAGGFSAWLSGIPAALKITAAAVIGAGVIGGGTAAVVNSVRQEIPVPAESEESTLPETVFAPKYVSNGDWSHYYVSENGERIEESCEDFKVEYWVKERSETEDGVRGWRCARCGGDSGMVEGVPRIGWSVQEIKERYENGEQFFITVKSANPEITEHNDGYDLTKVRIDICPEGSTEPALTWDIQTPASFYCAGKDGDMRTISLEPNRRYTVIEYMDGSGFQPYMNNYTFLAEERGRQELTLLFSPNLWTGDTP